MPQPPTKSILLVDDSPTLLMSIASVLEHYGFTITTAKSGEDGLVKLNASAVPFSLIIVDYSMPGINGVDLVRQARAMASVRFTPILLLTTESGRAKRDDAKAAGATGWLVKPVSVENLLSAIRQVMPGVQLVHKHSGNVAQGKPAPGQCIS